MQSIFSDSDKIEINNRRKTGKYTNLRKLNKTTSKSKKKSEGKIENFLRQWSENENTAYQNLWKEVKPLLRGFRTINVYVKK